MIDESRRMETRMLGTRNRLMLPVLLGAFFMYGFDGNVVNVALPALRHDLGAGPAALELVVGAYVFAYAAGVVTGGRLGDLFGHRRVFLLGIAGFSVASGLCAAALTPSELVAARFAQGLAAAAMVPQVLALITAHYEAGERARPLAWFASIGGISGICGQILGGLLLVGYGWRPVFLVNLPIGAVLLLAARRVLPTTDPRRHTSLDGIGVLAVSGSLALALVPLIIGRAVGWPAWAWILLIASVPAMSAALAWERRLARTGRAPLVDLGLFANHGFGLGLAVNAAFMVAFGSSIFVLSLTLQDGLGLTALQAGAAFLPMAVLAIAAALLSRRLLARAGTRILVAGGLISAAGTLLEAVALQTLGGHITAWWLIAAFAIIGLGNGLILPSLIGTPMTHVRPTQSGAAAGLLSTTQQFANVTGIAIIGTAFFAALGPHTDRAHYATAATTATWSTLTVMLILVALITLLTKTPTAPTPNPLATTKAP
ncbi:MFS transporter [Kribbella sp. NPDC055071]